MTDKTGGPAFPNVPDGAGDKWADWDTGMTLRDYFAAKAMNGDWSAQTADTGYFADATTTEGLQKNAELYYRMADAMLRAREK